MRRRLSYKKSSPKKEFINSYHVNEVPLPYYNPLADPYLQGYFSNSKVSKHIQHQGFVYKPEKDYPYQQRRLINFNKFHRQNSYLIPPTHLKSRSQIAMRGSSSYSDFLNEQELSRTQMFKRMSASELLDRDPGLSFGKEGLSFSQRPSTNSSSRRGGFSREGKQTAYIFRQSPRRREGKAGNN